MTMFYPRSGWLDVQCVAFCLSCLILTHRHHLLVYKGIGPSSFPMGTHVYTLTLQSITAFNFSALLP